MKMNNIIEFFNTKLPIGGLIEFIVKFLQDNLSVLFKSFANILLISLEGFENALSFLPALWLIIILSVIAYFIADRKVALFTLFGLLLVNNLGLWQPTIKTFSMVLAATFISILIGLPIGIIAAKKNKAHDLIMPIMDFMQTMPAFVYLIPAISFFGIGKVPGVIATVIFALPPCIRLTDLGIRHVPEDKIEAADAFGSTGMQKLIKVQIPLALPTIMAGINQTIMLSLSMVVIASMIGAGGLGSNVWYGIQRLRVGSAFEGGLAVVILAMILDKMTRSLTKNKKI